MSAWEALQTAPVDEIEEEVFRRMEGRSGGDPLGPWADGVLALCERIRGAEAKLAAVVRLVAPNDDPQTWICSIPCEDAICRLAAAVREVVGDTARTTAVQPDRTPPAAPGAPERGF